jgi:hypothetical protein
MGILLRKFTGNDVPYQIWGVNMLQPSIFLEPILGGEDPSLLVKKAVPLPPPQVNN